jgi:SagB-type dehydrogenase family enzyme
MTMTPVLDYHERSKHHLSRYAPGPGGLDWATQPDPFRRFAGAPGVDLPLLAGELPAVWDDLFRPGGVAPRPFTRDTLAALLQLTLGLAAWKSYGGNRWALRCNPSSGNLHPTEGYLACPDLPGLPAGVYHYQPHDHRLERRASAPLACSGGVLVALTGIHWREAWKYGVRAFRYCQHDCGHALAALVYAAAALGWPVRLCPWGDDAIAALTGVARREDFPGAEPEEPEALVWVGPGEPPAAGAVLGTLAGTTWFGRAHRLSPAHRDWPDIGRVATATRRPTPGEGLPTPSPAPAAALPDLAPVSREPVSRLVRRRRSAQAFDGATRLSSPAFHRILDALLPRAGLPPWSLALGPAQVHLVLFVHRVDGLEPGVYCLPRDPGERDGLRDSLRGDWAWAPVPGCPGHLPLFLLAALDARAFAADVSCHQEIAADSAFAVAMLARLDDVTPARPWRYRERFWEAGMVGQVLYLEAEAAGVQGTGIGCYFDDTLHEALGLEGTRYQDLYHFTVGGGLVDPRLATSPAYAHLAGRETVAGAPPR